MLSCIWSHEPQVWSLALPTFPCVSVWKRKPVLVLLLSFHFTELNMRMSMCDRVSETGFAAALAFFYTLTGGLHMCICVRCLAMLIGCSYNDAYYGVIIVTTGSLPMTRMLTLLMPNVPLLSPCWLSQCHITGMKWTCVKSKGSCLKVFPVLFHHL